MAQQTNTSTAPAAAAKPKNDKPADAATTTAPPPPAAAAPPPPTSGPVDLDDLDDAALQRGLDNGEKALGGFEGPSWCPQLAAQYKPELRDEALAALVVKQGPGSTTRAVIGGTLQAAYAWNRRLYFLDVTSKDGKNVIRVKLPENKSLFRGLNLCELGSKVALRFEGYGKAKEGQKAPLRFAVSAVGKPLLSKPRADSLYAESIDERKRRVAMEKLKAEQAIARGQAAVEEVGDGTGFHDDDLPF